MMRRLKLPPRIRRLKRDAHKGDRGRVLIVAGSRTMSGAARLAGWGALRGGAGLVTIATPEEVQPIVAAELPCAMTLPLPSRRGALTAAGAAAARALADKADAVACGPGLTTRVAPFLRRFLHGLATPLVLDADALNVIAAEPSLLDGVPAPRVLTPHPGEAARLLGRAISKDQVARKDAAADLAERFGAVAVLKGAGTIVCSFERCYLNRTGNPGMGTGGVGDILTGVIAARLAAGIEPFIAAVQAVFLHGRAGDLAATASGENAMIATDLVANLPAAVSELTESAPARTASREAEPDPDRGRNRGSRRGR